MSTDPFAININEGFIGIEPPVISGKALSRTSGISPDT